MVFAQGVRVPMSGSYKIQKILVRESLQRDFLVTLQYILKASILAISCKTFYFSDFLKSEKRTHGPKTQRAVARLPCTPREMTTYMDKCHACLCISK